MSSNSFLLFLSSSRWNCSDRLNSSTWPWSWELFTYFSRDRFSWGIRFIWLVSSFYTVFKVRSCFRTVRPPFLILLRRPTKLFWLIQFCFTFLCNNKLTQVRYFTLFMLAKFTQYHWNSFFCFKMSGKNIDENLTIFDALLRPPADPKGPPFDTFSEIHFWPTEPKIFLKAQKMRTYFSIALINGIKKHWIIHHLSLYNMLIFAANH